MRFFLLLLLFPSVLQAQAPDFRLPFTRDEGWGYTTDDASFSPKGRWLLVWYTGSAGQTRYELFDLPARQSVSRGFLPSRPFHASWSEDENRVAFSMPGGNVVVASVEKGFRTAFTAPFSGEPVFRMNTLLLGPRTPQPLFLFSLDSMHVFSPEGKWLRSVESDDYYSISRGWFDLLRARFALLDISGDEFHLFNDQGEHKGSFPLQHPGIMTGFRTTADGALFLYHSSRLLFVVETATGRTLLRHAGNNITSACFTPDNKNVLVATADSLFLLSKTGQVRKSAPVRSYYTAIGYTAYGSQLAGVDSKGLDLLNCQDYFPVPPPPVAVKPPVKTGPVSTPARPAVNPPPAAPAKPRWTLPYTIRDFVVPLERDSFFLYNAERGLRYHIKYKREPNMSLFAHPYSYIQNFGFSNESKYWNVNVYTLETTEGDARLASYSESSQLQDGDLMFGGQNYLARIPVPPATTLSWTNKLYKDTYFLTATLIDHTWKGRKGKCLVITRKDASRGIDESYYYLLGTGLVGIASGGKMAFER